MQEAMSVEGAIRDILFGDLTDVDVYEPITDAEQTAEMLSRLIRAVAWLLQKNVASVDELNSLNLEISHGAPYSEVHSVFTSKPYVIKRTLNE